MKSSRSGTAFAGNVINNHHTTGANSSLWGSIKMKEYELWLDESGDFEKNNQLHKHPSIVGGVLIEKGQFSDEEITQLVNAEANGGDAHSTTMDRQQVEEIMLPALEMLCHRHGKLVYFENKEHIATYSNRQLYLRILASGIVQLMQYLGKDGSFCIDVIIAVRYAPNDRGALEKIEEEESKMNNI